MPSPTPADYHSSLFHVRRSPHGSGEPQGTYSERREEVFAHRYREAPADRHPWGRGGLAPPIQLARIGRNAAGGPDRGEERVRFNLLLPA